MPRTLFPLELQLRTQPTLDQPARSAALTAVNNMMASATRAGELLAQARAENLRAATKPSVSTGRAAVIAREAYRSRTNAEVAKYRAAYSLMAEEQGNEAVRSQQAANQQTSDSLKYRILTDKANHHAKQRDLMLQAAAATDRAFASVPPLPTHVDGAVASAVGHEISAQPTMGWRPRKYTDLMGDFFPVEVRLAAGGLSGTHGGGLGVLGDGTVMASSEPWYTSLTKAIGFGVKAAGDAAQQEGAKQGAQDPAAANALQTGGGWVSRLSTLLTGGVNQGQQQSPDTGPSIGIVILGAGALGAAGYVVWRLIHK